MGIQGKGEAESKDLQDNSNTAHIIFVSERPLHTNLYVKKVSWAVFMPYEFLLSHLFYYLSAQ